MMKIDCYISHKCASEASLLAHVTRAAELESADAQIRIHRIREAEARALGILGSPTVLINGVDILPGELPGIA